MGVIHSKGEYIMNLDPDDMLASETDLEYLYSKTNNSQIDIINFNSIEISTYGHKTKQIHCGLYNETLFQPKLFDHFAKSEDFLIWNKLIKSETFLKAHEVYKNKIYGGYCMYGEDEIWSSLVNKYANSKICLDRVIYIYIRNPNSIILNKNNVLYCHDLIDWNEMFIYKVFSENKEMARRQTIRFLDLIRSTYVYWTIIKTNKMIKERYIKYLSSIKKEFNDDKIVLDKINNILGDLISLK